MNRRFRPWSRRRAFPPYELLEARIEHDARLRLDRLERLYHKGQDKVWDGREVLSGLIARHGPPRLPDDKRDAVLPLLSVLLWGELAAWAISADLAERIDVIEAKMAATSQAHDEARHFYVLRDYVTALGEPVPRLGGLGRRLLQKILDTESIVHKLIGMQLLVESNALAIFKALGRANIEPVLSGLLPYYERDEARHVGLGVMFLPTQLYGLSKREARAVWRFQFECVALLMTAGMPMRQRWADLGIDPRALAKYTVDLQDDIIRQMRGVLRESGAPQRRSPLGGLISPGGGLGPKILDFIHPPGGLDTAPPLNRAILDLWTRGAQLADRVLA